MNKNNFAKDKPKPSIGSKLKAETFTLVVESLKGLIELLKNTVDAENSKKIQIFYMS